MMKNSSLPCHFDDSQSSEWSADADADADDYYLSSSSRRSSTGRRTSDFVAARHSVFSHDKFSFLPSELSSNSEREQEERRRMSSQSGRCYGSSDRRRVSQVVDHRLKELTQGLTGTFITGLEEDVVIESDKSKKWKRRASMDIISQNQQSVFDADNNKTKNMHNNSCNSLNASVASMESLPPLKAMTDENNNNNNKQGGNGSEEPKVVEEKQDDDFSPPAPLAPHKLAMITDAPTGSAKDFISGRTDSKFEDHYELGVLLGEGAFGEVYKCRHLATNSERAVKIIDKELMRIESSGDYDEVIQEFQMLTHIDNPNVIRVYEFYDTEDKFYIVQELATGGELFDLLEQQGKLEEQHVSIIMETLLSCVHYLADNRIVHRDINLENILLSKTTANNDLETALRHVKLIDFGLATKCSENDDERLTEMVGKPRYIAPEVLGDNGYGLAYDVWSCGVTAYTLLVGFHPFDADHDMDVYQQIVDGYVDFNDPQWEHVSDDAKDFVAQLLTYDEHARPTAQAALSHSWLTSSNNASSNNNSQPSTAPVPSAAMVWSAAPRSHATSNAAAATTADVPVARDPQQQERQVEDATYSSEWVETLAKEVNEAVKETRGYAPGEIKKKLHDYWVEHNQIPSIEQFQASLNCAAINPGNADEEVPHHRSINSNSNSNSEVTVSVESTNDEPAVAGNKVSVDMESTNDESLVEIQTNDGKLRAVTSASLVINEKEDLKCAEPRRQEESETPRDTKFKRASGKSNRVPTSPRDSRPPVEDKKDIPKNSTRKASTRKVPRNFPRRQRSRSLTGTRSSDGKKALLYSDRVVDHKVDAESEVQALKAAKLAKKRRSKRSFEKECAVARNTRNSQKAADQPPKSNEDGVVDKESDNRTGQKAADQPLKPNEDGLVDKEPDNRTGSTCSNSSGSGSGGRNSSSAAMTDTVPPESITVTKDKRKSKTKSSSNKKAEGMGYSWQDHSTSTRRQQPEDIGYSWQDHSSTRR